MDDIGKEESINQDELSDGYKPRPAWQLWMARIGLIIFIVFVILQVMQIYTGGR